MPTQTVASISSSKPLSNPILGVATTIGVAGVLLMGVVSWVMLLVDRGLPIGLTIGISLLAYTTLVFLFLRNVESRESMVGAAGGLIGGAVSSIFLGSLMTKQPTTIAELESQANQFSSGGIALALGVIAGMVLLGWAAGKLRERKTRYATKDIDWRARYAWVVALSYLPLIAVGGLVTSTESGLAVPDSVTTYGSISILFPMSLMDEIRIYLEHSHRIFGTFAGLATILLVVRMFGSPARFLPRVMSVVLLLGVIAQGVMGALRVSEQSQGLATLHGVLAQFVFALAIATGVVCSRKWNAVAPSDEAVDASKSTRLLLMIATIGLSIQLVFGAMTRHLDSGHALMSHIGFSFIVVLLIIIAGAKCIKVGKIDRGVAGGAGAIRPYGATIHGLVMLQFTLGWGALAMTRTGEEGHAALPTSTELSTAASIRVGEAIMATSHHLIGALLLATTVAALMWALRIASRPKNG
ncbi:MAG: COX15/CtaA family protein [Phycisphaerales bacterium]|nr:COX15/CtaA family protein [Phycisphaerales bacterium]